MDELATFEKAVIEQAPRGALIAGASLSPDRAYGAALTFLSTATEVMDDVFKRNVDRWDFVAGTTGVGTYWTLLGDDEDERGVLRFAHEAPEGASAARVEYDGQEYRVLVRNGHFFFVAWNTRSPGDEPSLISFE